MRKAYDSHILKFEEVSGQRDLDHLHRVLKQSQGRAVILRIHQQGKRAEFPGLAPNFPEALQAAGIDLSLPFGAEVITRSPVSFREATQRSRQELGYWDRSDFEHLQRSEAAPTEKKSRSGLRGTPMFFRENGTSLDLLDLYLGQSLFLILNGQSFAKVDPALLSRPGIMTFGVNNGAHRFRPNFWTSVDDPTRFMRSIWADPKIMKFVPLAHFAKPIWDSTANQLSSERVAAFPNVIGYRRNESFTAKTWLHESTINWGCHADLGGGRSVMLAALRIAYLLGIRKVYLTGCDFFMDAQQKYWFEEERTPNAIKNNQNTYRILSGFFEDLLPHFNDAGFQVFNCTPESRLKVFPSMRLEDAVAASELSAAESTYGMYVDRRKAPHNRNGKSQEKHPL